MTLKRILFVDDDAYILKSLQRGLHYKSQDWDMVYFDHPLDALNHLKTEQIDVIVADLRMPEVNGLELARKINERNNTCRIIFLTGTADLETAITSINETNVFRFFTKPCPVDELCQGIEEALADLETERHKTLGNLALNKIPVGICMVDSNARLLFSNSAAQSILEKREGLFINQNQLLKAESPSHSAALLQAIKNAGNVLNIEESDAISLPRLSGKRDLSVRCLPVNRDSNSQILLFIGDPESPPNIDFAILSQLFSLSNSEAKLAAELSKGYSLEISAEHIGLTISTARTYLKQVFAKTNTNRQAELVKLILTSPAAIIN